MKPAVQDARIHVVFRHGLIAVAVVCTVMTVRLIGCQRAPAGPEGKTTREAPAASGEHDKSNVLLISLCSVRADHLGCYGYPRDTSPALDAFARDAVLFERAVTQWPKTAPSFASLHTGLFPHTTGIMRITPWQQLDDSVRTLAEVFQAAGYGTAAYVSSPALNTSVNLTQGFDTYIETFRRPRAFEQTRGGASGWLEIHGESPFFLWVHFNNAHVPYRPPADLHGMFVDDSYYDASRRVRLNPYQNDLPVDANHPCGRQIRRADLGGVIPDFVLRGRPDDRPAELDYYVAEYDAAVRGADRLIGGLLETLDRMNLSGQTVVVVLSDHGESLGDHNYYFEHGRYPYEPCQRVPLIIRYPQKLPAGHRASGPVGLIDVAPTVLDLAGLSIPAAFEGRSLVDAIRGEKTYRDVFFSAGYQLDFLIGIRRERWKLVRVSNEMDRAIMTGSQYELYDVVADPSETRNLYESRRDVAADLIERLERWRTPWWERAVRTVHKKPNEQLDEKTLKELESLGYVKGEGD